MKVPFGWLKEYVDWQGTPEEVADLLTMSGTEVEGIAWVGAPRDPENLSRFVVGRVVTRERHPNADRLSLCTVDVGEHNGGVKQIVCGADNFQAGDVVAVSLSGAVLESGLKLKKANLRGVESDGMMLSEQELGYEAKSPGIVVLPSDWEVGRALSDYLPVSEAVLELELTSNRTIGIRQTAGTLRINLPRTTTTKVLVHVGTGDARVERPSARNALYDPAQSQRWIDNGLPESGETLSAADLRRAINGYWGTTTRDVDRSGGVVSVDQGSDHTLVIDVELGLGSLTILDPRWSDVPDRVVQPVQLCTVGGGARGVVEDCPDVPVDRRVALCLNDSGFLVDCREDRPGTFDFPRVAACRGFDGEYRSCDELGIEPVGAELVSSPGPDDPPEATIAPAETSEPPTTAEPSEPSTTLAESTVAPPTPDATVPPVPTTVGG